MTSNSLPALLPTLSFAPSTASEVEAELIKTYENLAHVTLYPADPVRIFLESLAYMISVQNAVIDLAGKQNLLAFASGPHLDHLGVLLGVKRKKAMAARVMLRFCINQPLDFNVSIPQGTKASTKQGDIIFATSSSALIEAGKLFVDVLAVSILLGDNGNNLLPGQVCQLVDPLSYVVEVNNVESSSGGENPESDTDFRQRIHLAPETFSVAGPKGAYEALTLAVSTDISAVSVTSPSPGLVDVRFILKNNVLPDLATIALVQEALSASDVRPLTDNVTVSAPTIVDFQVDITWYISEKNSSLYASISLAINKAVNTYILWQKSQIGRDINPSELIRLVMEAGAKRVEVTLPEYTQIDVTALAVASNVTVTFGSVEAD